MLKISRKFGILYKYHCVLTIYKSIKKVKFMDFSKIRLNNERSTHVTKRLNRLSTWKFFKVLYRENVMRLLGFSLLMILCIAPILIVMMLGSFKQTELEQTFPLFNSLGFSTGTWSDMNGYLTQQINRNSLNTGLFAAISAVLVTVILSGGFAVIRDSFWTGKLSAVGVFKSLGKGFKANIFYAFVCSLSISFTVFGVYAFYMWLSTTVALWLAIVLTVVLAILAMFWVIYLLILCSVSVTYKQSLYENLDDSWRLLWLNVLPNILHFLVAILPVALFFVFNNGMLRTLYMMLIIMFGGIYFPLVWQTHMMKTFALFHPVETKKKRQLAAEQRQQQAAKAAADASSATALQSKSDKKRKNKGASAQADESAVSGDNSRDGSATQSDGDGGASYVDTEFVDKTAQQPEGESEIADPDASDTSNK